jgi:hypothetical protein
MVVLPSTTVYSVTNPISKSTSLSIDNLITGLGIMVIFYLSLGEPYIDVMFLVSIRGLGMHPIVRQILLPSAHSSDT